jgi:hypothetical protein
MTVIDAVVVFFAAVWAVSVLLLVVLVIQEVALWRREDAARAASRVRTPPREVCDELGLRRERTARTRTRGVA